MSGGNNTLEYRSIPRARASALPFYKPAIACVAAAFIPEIFWVLGIWAFNGLFEKISASAGIAILLLCIFVAPLVTFGWAFVLERRLRKFAGLYRGGWVVDMAAIVSAVHIVIVAVVYGGRGR